MADWAVETRVRPVDPAACGRDLRTAHSAWASADSVTRARVSLDSRSTLVRRSMTTATTSATPLATYCQKGSTPARLSPLLRTATMSAPNGAGDPPLAAGQRRAAEDDRDDAVELEADADVRVAGAEPRAEDDRGETGGEAGHRVQSDVHARDVDAGDPGRLLVAADRVHVAAEDGVVQEHREEDCDERSDDDRVRDDTEHVACPEVGPVLRQADEDRARGDEERRPSGDVEGPQRRDDRRDTEADDERGIQQAEPQAGHERREVGQRERRPRGC